MEELNISVSEEIGTVSGLWRHPEESLALLVLAHGAGAGMHHEFMETLADALATEQIATLRYQFPYMEAGKKRPDRAEVAQQAVRAAVSKAGELAPELPLFAGGKSFGGRMTSQLAAGGDLATVKGLIFFGFPLHPSGRPGMARADHLMQVAHPMLFLQGTRDRLAEVDLIEAVVQRLPQATLRFLEDGDHSFRMLKRTGISREQAIAWLAARSCEWIDELIS